ncbi:MAG: hypothetical protein OEZ02_10455 [Anaerolineae bacterium]|nr:hypothetical protein [Anaerolineae bacterium]
MKALAFGDGAQQHAQHNLWPRAEIETPSWNLYDPPKTANRRYERMLAYFVLQRVANLAVVDILKKWRALLKPGGELHVHVPSAEWFARQILDPQQPSPFALQHLFGLQLNEASFNLSAFTLLRLRQDCEKAGLAVREAKSYAYQIAINGQVYQAEQHHVIGVKA